MIKKSPWICFFNSGDCKGCILECIALITPKYDIERFGCVLRPSARHADILLATGIVTRQSKKRLKKIYSQMSHEKKVIAVGSCAISGGIFRNSYNFSGELKKIIPVDIFVPGCPPRPESIIYAILKILGDLNGRKKD
jgi:Ni,Fe-hydrogenase III small subunit